MSQNLIFVSLLLSVSLLLCSSLCLSLSLSLPLCLRLCLRLCLPTSASLSLPVVWSGLVWSGLAIILCFCTYLSGAILASTVCALYVVPYHNLMYLLIFLVLCRVLV